MSLRGELLLPQDALLIPAGDLSDETRARLRLGDDQFALTRPNIRSASKVLDADAARLVGYFREPTTVVNAVVRYAEGAGSEPREVLREAFPLIKSLERAHFLVPPGAEDANAIGPSLAVGEVFEGFTVIGVLQALVDTEVFQLRAPDGTAAALKLGRDEKDRKLRRAYEREAAILAHLGGEVAPRLIALGAPDVRPYVVAEWRPGIHPMAAADEARQRHDRGAVLQVAVAVAEAYAALHEHGVVHGDVHPRNAIVDRGGGVTLVDFGLARWQGLSNRLARTERGGVAWYTDPEYAAAREEERRPPADELSEQYSLAALLYAIFTGEQYLDFSVEREVLYRQILEEDPLPFVRRGAEPWPEVESILRTGLSKRREDRFSSVRELADRLRELLDASAKAPRAVPKDASGAQRVLERLLARVVPAGELWPPGPWEGPTASVNYGAAGVGYTLYRLAVLRDEPALLADADLWTARAWQAAGGEERPFHDEGFGIGRAIAEGVSPYHSRAGVACVEALVAQALGDMPSHGRAIAEFVSASTVPCDNLDLTLGRSGALLAVALLLESMWWPGEQTSEPLLELVPRMVAELWDELDSYPALPSARDLSFLGIAHGWGGVLYATLRACRAADVALPTGFSGRLDELAEAAEPYRRGLRWRRKFSGRDAPPDYMPGWCNGSAGLVSLWLLAERHTGDSRYAALAEGAAWNAWEDRARAANLCCGLAGRAYAQLAMYRHTGEAEWLTRAHELAEQAAEGNASPIGMGLTSLYKGDLAVAVLAADLEHPDRSCFPMFEEEGWPASK